MNYLPSARPKMFPKLKMLRNYQNFARLMPISFNVKNNFYGVLTKINPKIENAQDLFGTFDILNIPVSILM